MSLGIVVVIGLLVFSYFWKESMENITAKEQVEMYYESYNEKDFETFYDMLSQKEKVEMEGRSDREDILKIFEKAWSHVEIIKIEEQSGGTEKGTIVSATIHYPVPDATFIETFKLIKVNGVWKFDDYIGKELID